VNRDRTAGDGQSQADAAALPVPVHLRTLDRSEDGEWLAKGRPSRVRPACRLIWFQRICRRVGNS
jgi:hypothetical protein